ncbi:MAG: ArnT family glycosyltransferase [Thermodesulfobacteriota bacterium]
MRKSVIFLTGGSGKLNRATILLFSTILLLTLLPGIKHGLWRPDEPQVAGVCAEMAYTKDFVVPRLNGNPFLEKPPLYYAVGAMFGDLFGRDNDLSYRLATLFFACLVLFLTFLIASLREGTVNGLLASGILITTGSFFRLARWIQVDMSLVFAVTLTMYAHIRLSEGATKRHVLLMGLGIGLSFMAKGLVGPAIVAAAVVADIAIKRDFSIIKTILPFWVLAVMFMTILPWILALYERGGMPFLRDVIVVNNLMRFTGAREGAALGHMQGPFYYFRVFPLNFLPWTFAFIPALVSFLKKPQTSPYLPWFIGPFILLSIASAKRGLYLAPVFPACACMTASWLARPGGFGWQGLMIKAFWAAAAVSAFLPFLGIFFGQPLLGVILGFLSVGSLFFLSRWRSRDTVSLVLIICVSTSALMTVYYASMKEKRDYLGFTKGALSKAGGSEIIVLAPDEIFEGTLPMVTGRTYKCVERIADIRREGFYIWADKRDVYLREIEKRARVDIVLEKKIGDRSARLAFIKPGSDRTTP